MPRCFYGCVYGRHLPHGGCIELTTGVGEDLGVSKTRTFHLRHGKYMVGHKSRCRGQPSPPKIDGFDQRSSAS